MKWSPLEVLGGSCRGAGPTCNKQSLTKHEFTNCGFWLESIIPFNIRRSRDFSFEWNIHKSSISCECRTGPSRVDKWASSHLPLVNKTERTKKANRQQYRHFLSVAREFIQPSPPTFKLKTRQFSYKRYHRDCPLVKCKYNQAGQTALHNCTCELLESWTIHSNQHYSHMFTAYTLKRSSWGFLRQTDITLCSVAGQHLVGQWLISSSFSPEVSLPVRSTVKVSAIQCTGRWVIL